MSRIRIRDAYPKFHGARRSGEKSQQRKCLLVKVALGDPQRFIARSLSQSSVFLELWTTLDTVIEHHTKSCHIGPPIFTSRRLVTYYGSVAAHARPGAVPRGCCTRAS